jgi:hypothetical protein
MVRRRKPQFKKVEAFEACFCELLHLEVGKEARIDTRSSRLVGGSLKMKAKKETMGLDVASIELLGRITDMSFDNNRPKNEN